MHNSPKDNDILKIANSRLDATRLPLHIDDKRTRCYVATRRDEDQMFAKVLSDGKSHLGLCVSHGITPLVTAAITAALDRGLNLTLLRALALEPQLFLRTRRPDPRRSLQVPKSPRGWPVSHRSRNWLLCALPALRLPQSL